MARTCNLVWIGGEFVTELKKTLPDELEKMIDLSEVNGSEIIVLDVPEPSSMHYSTCIMWLEQHNIPIWMITGE